MTKGLQRSLARGPKSTSPIEKLTLDVNSSISVEATGVGTGSVQVSDFPEGNILFLGAAASLQFDATGQSGITTNWTGDFGVGSAPIAGDTIDGSEGDIIPSTALAAASARLSPVTRGASTSTLSGTVLDNTDGSLEVNLNLVVDDAAISAASTVTAGGQVVISYVVLGDD